MKKKHNRERRIFMAPMEEFIEMLKSHNRIVFFGGAGVSTESDIPDFRGKAGCIAKRRSFPGRRKKCSPTIFTQSIL